MLLTFIILVYLVGFTATLNKVVEDNRKTADEDKVPLWFVIIATILVCTIWPIILVVNVIIKLVKKPWQKN